MTENRDLAVIPESYTRLLFLFLALNLFSAILFLRVVNRPVYDDGYNLFDVHSYATKGISVSTIQAQRNAVGPTSFVWMACGVRLLGGDELRAARTATLFSWFLLGVGVIAGGRLSRFPSLWYGALLSALVLPHSAMATATLLTEGPALLFAMLGALAWTEFVSRSSLDPRSCILGCMGGLSLGVAVTCRQYYLVLFASAVTISVLSGTYCSRSEKRKWLGAVILSLTIAAAPILAMLLIWKGVTSPSMAAGTSYVNYHAGLGLNMARPFVALFYVLLYLLPLSFPSVALLQSPQRLPALVAASLAAILAVYFRFSLLQPGPFNSLTRAAARFPTGSKIVLALVAGATAYNAIAVALALWRKRSSAASCLPLRFALLTVLFFVVEQGGVGGNIRFYDRYVLQLAPFLGIIAFWLFPKLTQLRIAILIGMSALSQFMLWRLK